MFYRFLSKLATQERLQAFPVRVPEALHLNPWGLPVTEYEDCFEPLQTSPSHPAVTVLRAPAYGADRFGLRLRFHRDMHRGAQLPDIWGVAEQLIVSERVKRVIDALDDFEHEFIEIGWIDADQQPIATDQRWYRFLPRRFVHVEPGPRIAGPKELGFCPIPHEENFLGRVLDDAALRETVEQIPVWRHFGQAGGDGRRSSARMVLYLNSRLAEALTFVGTRGFKHYSQAFGAGEESVIEL